MINADKLFNISIISSLLIISAEKENNNASPVSRCSKALSCTGLADANFPIGSKKFEIQKFM